MERGSEGTDPIRGEKIEALTGSYEVRRETRHAPMAVGTLACPACDAPVALAGPAHPADVLACPFCGHADVLRGFLTLGAPTRPARVVVRVGLPPLFA
jgi:hypothetical protein